MFHVTPSTTTKTSWNDGFLLSVRKNFLTNLFKNRSVCLGMSKYQDVETKTTQSEKKVWGTSAHVFGYKDPCCQKGAFSSHHVTVGILYYLGDIIAQKKCDEFSNSFKVMYILGMTLFVPKLRHQKE